MASKEIKQRHSQFDPSPNTIKEYFTPIPLGLRFKKNELHMSIFHCSGWGILPIVHDELDAVPEAEAVHGVHDAEDQAAGQRRHGAPDQAGPLSRRQVDGVP